MHDLEPETLAALLRDMPVPVVVYHAASDVPAEMRLVAANGAVSDLLGVDMQAGIGRTIGELFAASLDRPEGRERIRRMHAAAVDGGTTSIDPMDSGDPRLGGWYRMRCIGLGRRQLAVFIDDITEAMHQAEQLQIWSGLARSISAAVVVARVSTPGADPANCPVAAFNPAARRVFGVVDEGLPLGVILRDWQPPGYGSGGRGLATGEKVEWHCERGDRVFRVQITAADRWLMLSATDDTEGARMRATIERHAELLARSNAELDAFANVVSHDLKAPLRSMASFSELLAKRYAGQLDARADRYLTHIVDGARRMRDLIADLLAWSRMGRDGPVPTMVEFGPVVQRVERALGERIAETGATLSHGPLPAVWGIEFQLVQLVQNLVENALKYHRPDVPPRIRIAVAEQRDGWRIEVEDNGVGIPAERREDVFEPLRRFAPHHIAGSGIGLAICRRIVQRSRGRIWIEDADGPGIRVVVELPRPARAP